MNEDEDFARKLARTKKPKPQTRPLSSEDAVIKAGRALRSVEEYAAGDHSTLREEIEYAKAQALVSIAISLIRMDRK